MNAYLDDRAVRPLPPIPSHKDGDEGGGPSRQNVRKPDSRNLLDRMKRVDPNQAKRYRQRSGE